jgi:predicted phosphodiesterase
VRVAALYDVHGNLPALEAVLAEVERESIDLIVSGGDLVSGAFPAESLRALLELGDGVRYVRGNADRAVVEFAAGRSEPQHGEDWVAARLDSSDLRALEGFEAVVSVEVDGLGPTLFCHASPASDEAFFLETTEEPTIVALLGAPIERTVVCGHTHMQFDLAAGGTRVVNAGSVGMPYEAAPGAYWVALGPDVQLRRTEYDLQAAADRIRATDYPGAEEFVRENVLTVPSRAEALAAFEPRVTRGA